MLVLMGRYLLPRSMKLRLKRKQKRKQKHWHLQAWTAWYRPGECHMADSGPTIVCGALTAPAPMTSCRL